MCYLILAIIIGGVAFGMVLAPESDTGPSTVRPTMSRSGCPALADAIASGTGDAYLQARRQRIFDDTGC